MRRFLTILSLIAGLGVAPVAAQSDPVVVELYTSQGCSSCPPADAMLLELDGRADVIALALHVDYWDYIGWADTHADPAFTRRQQLYAHAAGHTMIYTPQMIIGGRDHVIGTKPMEVTDAIRAQQNARSGVRLELDRTGNSVTIRAAAAQRFGENAVIQLVRYEPREAVDIQRGENAGRRVIYGNIVTDWDVVGEWDGAQALSMRARAPGAAPVVVIIQEAGMGPILAAGVLR